MKMMPCTNVHQNDLFIKMDYYFFRLSFSVLVVVVVVVVVVVAVVVVVVDDTLLPLSN